MPEIKSTGHPLMSQAKTSSNYKLSYSELTGRSAEGIRGLGALKDHCMQTDEVSVPFFEGKESSECSSSLYNSRPPSPRLASGSALFKRIQVSEPDCLARSTLDSIDSPYCTEVQSKPTSTSLDARDEGTIGGQQNRKQNIVFLHSQYFPK